MRAAAICVGVLLAAACSGGPPDVTAERSDVAPSLRAPGGAPATGANTGPPPEASAAAEYLLLPHDAPEWTVAMPSSVAPVEVADTGCAAVDEVRNLEAIEGIGTFGVFSGARFTNTAVEMESTAAAAAMMDRLDDAPTECASFEDSSGTWFLEAGYVQDGGWRAGAVVYRGRKADSPVGYWQRGTTVVRLAVEGDRAWTRFDELARTLAAKLRGDPVTTSPNDQYDDPYDQYDDPYEPETSQPSEDEWSADDEWSAEDMWSDEGWENEPLADVILDASDVGPDWIRWGVEFSEHEPGGEPWDCGLVPPPTPAGLVATYGTDGVGAGGLMQMVGGGDAAVAQAWIDVVRVLPECADDPQSGFGPGTVATLHDPTSTELPGATDAVILYAEDADYGGYNHAIYAAARYDDAFVFFSWIGIEERFSDPAPSIDSALALLRLAVPD